jgi:hypothetical protein
MKSSVILIAGLILGVISLAPPFAPAQSESDTKSPPLANVTTDYPKGQAGVLIQSSGWTAIPAAAPSKSKVKRGLAASVSYGAVPAAIIAQYDGPHAQTRIEPGRPVICVCHVLSIPGAPALVRLHSKKDFRELDGGRLRVFRSKIAEAGQNDLIPIEVSQPESSVWLVRPREALTAGEYALMLGTQNMGIFPFTVSGADDLSASPPDKH